MFRRDWTARLALCLGLCLGLCLAAGPAMAQGANRIGANQLIDRIGAAVDKVVVINFWATWCKPCQMEIPDLIKLRSKMSESQVLILGISVDQDPGEYFRYVKQTPFNYPVFLAGNDVPSLFGVSTIPKLVIFNRKGEQVVNHVGYVPADELAEALRKIMDES